SYLCLDRTDVILWSKSASKRHLIQKSAPMAIIRKRKTQEEKERENPSTCQTFTDMYYRYIEQGARNREKKTNPPAQTESPK
ncbi:hypothetical protein, partial [Porphyromonas gingivalis]|uniref:hypothetical protein n=2 Tax=Porphyromonas gingivalis TaxID=837 RepID=UPI001E48EFA7